MAWFQRLAVLLIAVCLHGAAFAQTPPPRRVALVIANSAYAHAPARPTAINDAEVVAASLRGIGFNVTEISDTKSVTRTHFAAIIDIPRTTAAPA